MVPAYWVENFPFFTVSISNASTPRPLWSVAEKLKMPPVPTTPLRFSMAVRTASVSVLFACSIAFRRMM